VGGKKERKGNAASLIKRRRSRKEREEIAAVNAKEFSRLKLTIRAAISSEDPAFSWETFRLANDRWMVGEPVEAVADILIDPFEYLREGDCQRDGMTRALLEEGDEKIRADGSDT
jgi:hypothetical protein